MNDTEIIGALLDQTNEALLRAGVQGQSRFVNGVATYRFLFPLRDGRMLAIESSVRPNFEIGAGRIAKKIKKGVVKVAKSKAFGKVLKAASVISSVVPGGQALGAGLAAAATAQALATKAAAKGKKAVQAIKKGVQGAKTAVKAAKGVKAAVKGKPAVKTAAAARTTVKALGKGKPAAALAASNSAHAGKGQLVRLPSGRQALVTFVN